MRLRSRRHLTAAVRNAGVPHHRIHNQALKAAEERALAQEDELVAALIPLFESTAKEVARAFTHAARRSLQAATMLALTAEHGPGALRALVAVGDGGVTATSTMIAVKPRPEEADALAQEQGLDPSTLHVTLAYLGQVEGDLEDVAAALRPVAANHAPLVGQIGGVGIFGDNGNGYPIILLPSVPGLVELRVDATEALHDAGVDFARNHGYLPHMTVNYADDNQQEDDAVFEAVGTPLHFDDLLIVRGDTEVIPLPLIGAPPVTASGRRATADQMAKAGAWARQRGLRLQDWFDEFVSSTALLEKIAAVAEENMPDGGYGETAWNAGAKTVWWNCGDWTSDDEMEAAETAFLAIDEVEAVEVCDECGLPEGDEWEIVWTRPVRAAGPPPWNEPHPNQVIDVPALVSRLRGVTDPVRQAAVEDVMKATFSGVPTMSLEDALAYYHSPKAYALNDALRSGKELTDEQKAVAQTLDAAFGAAPRGGLVLYRGIPDSSEMFGKARPSISQTVDLPSYTSTSKSAAVADDFASGISYGDQKPVIMRIVVPEGTPVLRVPAGPYGDQDEILLPRDLSIQVHSVEGKIITADEADAGADVPKFNTSVTRAPTVADLRESVAAGPGIAWDVTNPFTAKVLAQAGSQVTEIADTTQLNVMRVIKASYEAGLSIPDTAKAIQAGMAEAAADRARLIARTELAGAVNGGSLAAVEVVSKATGGTYTKTWLTAPGARFPRHEEYDGLDEQTVPLSGYFQVGGFSLQHPADPEGPPEEVCNCRCTMVYNSPGDDDEGDEGDSEE